MLCCGICIHQNAKVLHIAERMKQGSLLAGCTLAPLLATALVASDCDTGAPASPMVETRGTFEAGSALRDGGADAGVGGDATLMGAGSDATVIDAGSDTSSPTVYSVCPDGMAPSFSSISTRMLSTGSCGSSQNDCHSSTGALPKPEGGYGSLLDFSLDAATLYKALLGADGGGHPATNVDGDAGGALLRVAPGNADASFLYIKLAMPAVIDPRYGVSMPPGEAVCPATVDAVRSWIDNGAAAN